MLFCLPLYASGHWALGVVLRHLTAPAEVEMPVANQLHFSSALLIPVADHPEAHVQLEQHCQSQTLNYGS